jgi:hypothetical protein
VNHSILPDSSAAAVPVPLGNEARSAFRSRGPEAMKIGELELRPDDLVLVRPSPGSGIRRPFMARIDGLWTDKASGEAYAVVRRQIGDRLAGPSVIPASEIDWVYAED